MATVSNLDRRPIRTRLADYYSPVEAEVWLDLPQPLLGGERGKDLIAAGREDELHRLLDMLDEGVYL